MNTLKSTLLHTLEIAVVIGVAYVALNYFGVKSELVQDAVIIALAAATKFVRSSSAVPIVDYVNK